jgi:hypothetical protein
MKTMAAEREQVIRKTVNEFINSDNSAENKQTQKETILNLFDKNDFDNDTEVFLAVMYAAIRNYHDAEYDEYHDSTEVIRAIEVVCIASECMLAAYESVDDKSKIDVGVLAIINNTNEIWQKGYDEYYKPSDETYMEFLDGAPKIMGHLIDYCDLRKETK